MCAIGSMDTILSPASNSNTILMMNDFTLLVSRSERLTHAREHLNEMFGKKYPKNFRRLSVIFSWPESPTSEVHSS